MRNYRIIALVLVMVACKAAQVSQVDDDYDEDLSSLRLPMTEEEVALKQSTAGRELLPAVTLSGDITMEIDSINRIIVEQNMARNSANGYIIQVYVGTNRDEANWALDAIKKYYPDLDPRLSYRQPNYRVKAGEFYDRLEATRLYNQIKTSFPKAILLPEKLALKD